MQRPRCFVPAAALLPYQQTGNCLGLGQVMAFRPTVVPLRKLNTTHRSLVHLVPLSRVIWLSGNTVWGRNTTLPLWKARVYLGRSANDRPSEGDASFVRTDGDVTTNCRHGQFDVQRDVLCQSDRRDAPDAGCPNKDAQARRAGQFCFLGQAHD